MDDIEFKSGGGFARIDGVTLWIYPPRDDLERWGWTAQKYNGEYSGGCPRLVEGIGQIEGRADTEEEAVRLATAAAGLIGRDPAALVEVDIDSPIPYRLVAVADGPDEKVPA